MASVTQRIKEIQQPYGGFLPFKLFSETKLSDGKTLNKEENIHPSLVGMSVDYLTRFMMGTPAIQAFNISLMGAAVIKKDNIAFHLVENIHGLDNTSITCACKLAGFDVCYRLSAARYRPIENINPDISTIENIRTMVKRSMIFFGKYGPVVKSEVTFEGGYSPTVNAGDGDFMTSDTLWDFKTSKDKPTSKHTLQLLMYYVMGKHSIHKEFQHITQLGFFNPRLNIVYTCPTSAVSAELYEEISNHVICYGQPAQNPPPQTTPVATSEITEDFTVSEVAETLSISKSKVYNAIHAGHLDAYKKHGKYFITFEAFSEYLRYMQTIRLIIILGSAAFCILTVLLMLLFFN